MKTQQLIDDIATHLLTQNRKSVDAHPHVIQCMYRFEGLKCAIGALIPDDLYNPGMERLGVENVLHTFPILRKHLHTVYEVSEREASKFQAILEEAQSIHDNKDWSPKAWPTKLDELRAEYLYIPKEVINH